MSNVYTSNEDYRDLKNDERKQLAQTVAGQNL